MSYGAKLAIKILVVAAVWLPYRFIVGFNSKTSFLQDLFVAALAFGAASLIISAVEKNKGQ